MSGKHDLDLDLYIKKLERQIDVERIEHAEHLAQKNEEIRQLKRERRKTPYWTPRKPVWRR